MEEDRKVGKGMEEKLALYNKVRKVPDEAKKPILAGRLKGMTDINPMWRIKTLTEQFGPCGIGWYYEVEEKWTESMFGTFDNETDKHLEEQIANVMIHLYIKDPTTGEWSKPITGVGGSKMVSLEKNGFYVDDEAFKKAQTDALSVACKNLGIGADVYWDSDNDKYIDHGRENFNSSTSTANSKRSTSSAKTSTIDPEAKEWQKKIEDYVHAHNMTVKEIAKDYKVNSKTSAARLKEVYDDLTGASTADSNVEHEQASKEQEFAEIDEHLPWEE